MASLGNGGIPLAQTRGCSHVTHSYWLLTGSVTSYIILQRTTAGVLLFWSLEWIHPCVCSTSYYRQKPLPREISQVARARPFQHSIVLLWSSPTTDLVTDLGWCPSSHGGPLGVKYTTRRLLVAPAVVLGVEASRSYSPLSTTTLRWVLLTSERHHIGVDGSYSGPPHWGWRVILTSERHHIEVDGSYSGPPHWGWRVILTSERHHIEVDGSYSPLSATTLRLTDCTHLWAPPHWGWQVVLTSERHHIEVDGSYSPLRATTLRLTGHTHLWAPPHWGWQVVLTSERHHIEVDGSYSPLSTTTLRLTGRTHLWEPPHWGWRVVLTSERHHIEIDRSYSPLRATTLRLIGPTQLWVPPHWGWQVATHLWEPPRWGWLVLLTSEGHHIEVDGSYLAETLCRYRCYFRIRRSVQSYQLWHQLHQNALLVYNQQWNKQCHGNRSLK